MDRQGFLKEYIEKTRLKYFDKDYKMTKEEILKYMTEDFKVTNLKDHSTIGQGIEYAILATEMEVEKKLVFKVLQLISAGEFEVCKYQVTNGQGQVGGGTVIYRFRGEKVCEMILLDHD